ncbi:MAG: hypothetical protein U9M98_02470 [Patescibacteria group bacterium]|nr:hypothetical protein [Patescibacteria group bacterium]
MRTKAALRQMSISELRGYRREVEGRLERAQEGLSPYSMEDIDRELDRIDAVIAEKEAESRDQKKSEPSSGASQLKLDL